MLDYFVGFGGGADGRDQTPRQVPRHAARALPGELSAAAARHPALNQPLQLETATAPRPPAACTSSTPS